jgi:hypothetical protein
MTSIFISWGSPDRPIVTKVARRLEHPVTLMAVRLSCLIGGHRSCPTWGKSTPPDVTRLGRWCNIPIEGLGRAVCSCELTAGPKLRLSFCSHPKLYSLVRLLLNLSLLFCLEVIHQAEQVEIGQREDDQSRLT